MPPTPTSTPGYRPDRPTRRSGGLHNRSRPRRRRHGDGCARYTSTCPRVRKAVISRFPFWLSIAPIASRCFFYMPWNQTRASDSDSRHARGRDTTETKRVDAAPWRARPRPSWSRAVGMSLPTNTNSLPSRWSATAGRPCRTCRHNSSRCSNSSPRQKTPSSSIAGARSGVVLDGARAAWRNAGMSVATGTIPDYMHRVTAMQLLRRQSYLPALAKARRRPLHGAGPAARSMNSRTGATPSRSAQDQSRAPVAGAPPADHRSHAKPVPALRPPSPSATAWRLFSSGYAWQLANSTGGHFRRQDRRKYARPAHRGRAQSKPARGLGPDLSAGASLLLRKKYVSLMACRVTSRCAFTKANN